MSYWSPSATGSSTIAVVFSVSWSCEATTVAPRKWHKSLWTRNTCQIFLSCWSRRAILVAGHGRVSPLQSKGQKSYKPRTGSHLHPRSRDRSTRHTRHLPSPGLHTSRLVWVIEGVLKGRETFWNRRSVRKWDCQWVGDSKSEQVFWTCFGVRWHVAVEIKGRTTTRGREQNERRVAAEGFIDRYRT